MPFDVIDTLRAHRWQLALSDCFPLAHTVFFTQTKVKLKAKNPGAILLFLLQDFAHQIFNHTRRQDARVSLAGDDTSNWGALYGQAVR